MRLDGSGPGSKRLIDAERHAEAVVVVVERRVQAAARRAAADLHRAPLRPRRLLANPSATMATSSCGHGRSSYRVGGQGVTPRRYTGAPMAEPRDLVERLEREPALPKGEGERFSGYGVMSCPFASGHILCHRRFPASSVGPAYTSIWHRDPDGRWRFYQDVGPRQACSRFFGAELAGTVETPVETAWTGPRALRLSAERLRPVRHGIQRARVVLGLVRGALLLLVAGA